MERTKKCPFHKFMSIFPRYASANTKILKYFKTEGFLVWYNLAARMDIKPRRVIPLIWHIFFFKCDMFWDILLRFVTIATLVYHFPELHEADLPFIKTTQSSESLRHKNTRDECFATSMGGAPWEQQNNPFEASFPRRKEPLLPSILTVTKEEQTCEYSKSTQSWKHIKPFPIAAAAF